MEQGTGEVEPVLRVLVVDDHPLFRAGLIAALGARGDVRIAGEAENAEQALAHVRREHVDLALVDVLLPSISGITLTRQLREIAPSCAVLGLSSIGEPGLIADMLRAGAGGFALKSQPPEELIEAIHHVAGGVRYLPRSISKEQVERALAESSSEALGDLTRREREIFELLIRGHTNGEIAARLFISVRTVETHRLHITKKLSARSLAELRRLVAREGGV